MIVVSHLSLLKAELEGLLWLMTVMMLFELCQKQGKQVDIKYWKNGEKNVATVYVDGKFIASGSSEKKETAKLMQQSKLCSSYRNLCPLMFSHRP